MIIGYVRRGLCFALVFSSAVWFLAYKKPITLLKTWTLSLLKVITITDFMQSLHSGYTFQ